MDDCFNNFSCSGSRSVPCRGPEKLGKGGATYHCVCSHLVELFSRKELGHRDATKCCKTLHWYHCGVTVATDYKAFDLIGVSVQSFAEIIFETAAVESSTHTDDAVFWKT